MNLTSFIILTGTAVVSWWLSGYDSGLSSADKDRFVNLIRRLVRCGITMLLVSIAVATSGLYLFIVAAPLGVIWAGCLSELFAVGFLGLVYSEDKREFDPKRVVRDLDQLAELVHNGQNEEAIELCKRLKESGEASATAIDATLFRIYSHMFGDDHVPNLPSLAETRRLRAQGKFGGAESHLNSLLKKEPDNLAAVLMLLRIYVLDMSRPEKADALLRRIEQQPRVPPGFIGYARHSIAEWRGIVPPKTNEGIESLLVSRLDSASAENALNSNAASIDELLASGHLATAIELLEGQLKEQPLNFDLWMKLAEAHGVHCGNIIAAGKVIDKIAATFSPEQIQLAKAKLEEWRTAHRA